MDTILCDELIQEIFHRLPRRSSTAVSLVSRRWLRLLRSSQTSLSLKLLTQTSTIPLLTPFLSHHIYLSSLSITAAVCGCDASGFSDRLLLSVASSSPNLKRLRFSTGPVSLSSLLSLSFSCPHLSSLSVSLSRPFSLHWLLYFLSLKHLSLHFTGVAGEFNSDENLNAEFQLESLSLSGIRPGDYALNLLWRNCKNLKKLKLKSCESLGDNGSFSSFLSSNRLQQVEFRTCRTIIDLVLSKLAENENCNSLNSLLIYDGGSREGLLQFITQSSCNLQKLDLRLPLDLNDNHLLAIAQNFTGLSTLRLQSSSLITGEGLVTLSLALSNEIEELSLINCDTIGRETGLLATLGQNLRKLKILNLSYNDKLVDKELASMVVSCDNLRELKLRGCMRLSNAALGSVLKNCRDLESVDIMECCGIDEEGVKNFVGNCIGLRRVEVEESKISDGLKVFAANNRIEVGC